MTTTPRRTGPRPPRPSSAEVSQSPAKKPATAKPASGSKPTKPAGTPAVRLKPPPGPKPVPPPAATPTQYSDRYSLGDRLRDFYDYLRHGSFRYRQLPWITAPLSIIVVFCLGLAMVWLPPIPRLVTSPVGPSLGAIGEPTRLVIPSIDVDAAVVPIELDAGDVLHPPADVHKVGWWVRSAQPGAKEGQSLITGHSVRLGDGAMDRLGDVQRGATIQVYGPRPASGGKSAAKPKVASYLVEKVFVYSKKQLADHSEDLFGQGHHPRRLVLVTCTDWDGKEYRSNILVYAQPA